MPSLFLFPVYYFVLSDLKQSQQALIKQDVISVQIDSTSASESGSGS